MSPPRFDAALTSVVNPTRASGGTLRLARTSDFDSLDPGNTYYAFAWNFLRLIGRTLVTFRPAPGDAGRQLVPDLARSLGMPSDGGATWTYRLRRGVRFEDGTEVTARHVRYAIERSNFSPDRCGCGPMYFRGHLEGIHAIEVPDPYTLLFRLREPFAGFDFLATLPSTSPVPCEHDTEPASTGHPLATGPYRVHSYRRGVRLELVRNPHWSPATDPIRSALADRIVVDLGIEGSDVDHRLLTGQAQVDLAGVGVQPAALERIMADPALRRQADNPYNGFTWMFAMSTRVAPFGDVHCRRAVQYAADKRAMQAAYGGPLTGDIASTILPPTLEGREEFDLYPTGGQGDPAAARKELAAAGLPGGFGTRIAAREDRGKEFAAALALSASLARVGIEAEVVPFQSGDYFEKYAGVPQYLHDHGIGIVMFGWGADFPDGFGFLHQIVHGSAIKAVGNHNFGELNLAEVNDLLDRAARTADPALRARSWGRIDRLVMENASLCPYLHAKSLLFRGPTAGNVYVSGAYGMYDYVSLSVTEDGSLGVTDDGVAGAEQSPQPDTNRR
jgi:peptide/nickel transport system substrate-binding protein